MAEDLSIVLIASSLAENSDEVVRAGLAVARARGAKVEVVHAFTMPPTLGRRDLSTAGGVAEPWSALRDSLLARLGDQVRRLAGPEDAVAGWHVEPGPAHATIEQTARSLDALLVVVGAEEKGTGPRLGLGSTVDRVLRQATRPVCVVRGSLAIPPRRILAPVDLSDLSGEELRCGLRELDTLQSPGTSDDEVTDVELLFVVDNREAQYRRQFSEEQVRRFASEELERFAVENCGARAMAMARKVREGDPRHEILDEQEAWGADIVLLGTHGRSGFERLLLGSVASYVSRRATSSVLVVPPEAALQLSLSLDATRNEASGQTKDGDDMQQKDLDTS